MLTPSAVSNAKPKGKAYKLSDERGMFLLVQPTGSTLWPTVSAPPRQKVMQRSHDYVTHRKARLMGANLWSVCMEDADNPIGNFATQHHAELVAVEVAKQDYHERGINSQVHIQRPNGEFLTEHTYGGDPPRYIG